MSGSPVKPAKTPKITALCLFCVTLFQQLFATIPKVDARVLIAHAIPSHFRKIARYIFLIVFSARKTLEIFAGVFVHDLILFLRAVGICGIDGKPVFINTVSHKRAANQGTAGARIKRGRAVSLFAGFVQRFFIAKLPHFAPVVDDLLVKKFIPVFFVRGIIAPPSSYHARRQSSIRRTLNWERQFQRFSATINPFNKILRDVSGCGQFSACIKQSGTKVMVSHCLSARACRRVRLVKHDERIQRIHRFREASNLSIAVALFERSARQAFLAGIVKEGGIGIGEPCSLRPTYRTGACA